MDDQGDPPDTRRHICPERQHKECAGCHDGGRENGQHLTASASELSGIHFVNLSFLQKLSVAHEPLISSESALAPEIGLPETYAVDEIVVLYPGERTENGTPMVISFLGLVGHHDRHTLPNRLFLLPPSRRGRRTTSK